MLTLHGRPISTPFELLGHQENDMTAVLGFVLDRCPVFAEMFARDLELLATVTRSLDRISLQTRQGAEGITDIELGYGDRELAILEAKRGALLPARQQLRR